MIFFSASPSASLQGKTDDIFSAQNEQKRGILAQECVVQRVDGMQKILNPGMKDREEVPFISAKKESLEVLNTQPEAYRLRQFYEKIGQFFLAIFQPFRKVLDTINHWIFVERQKKEEQNEREKKSLTLIVEPVPSQLFRDKSLPTISSEKVENLPFIVEPQKSPLASQKEDGQALHLQASPLQDNQGHLNRQVPTPSSAELMQKEKEVSFDQMDTNPSVVKPLENSIPPSVDLSSQQPMQKTLSETNQDQVNLQQEVTHIDKETSPDKPKVEIPPTAVKGAEILLVVPSVTVAPQVATPQKLSRAARKLIDFFDKSGYTKSEGLFRISADQAVLEIFYHYLLSLDSDAILPNRINCNKKEFVIDANLVAGALKKIYKEMNVFGSSGLREQCIQIGKKFVENNVAEADVVADLKTLVNQLDPERKQDLHSFIDLLQKIEQESEINKMSISNLAISINDLLCSEILPAVPLPQKVEKKPSKKGTMRKIQTALHFLPGMRLSNESLSTTKPVAKSLADLTKLGEDAARIRKITEYLIIHCEKVFL